MNYIQSSPNQGKTVIEIHVILDILIKDYWKFEVLSLSWTLFKMNGWTSSCWDVFDFASVHHKVESIETASNIACIIYVNIKKSNLLCSPYGESTIVIFQ